MFPTLVVSQVRVWMTEPVERLQMFNKTGKKWKKLKSIWAEVAAILQRTTA
jgi:hypothetical protein